MQRISRLKGVSLRIKLLDAAYQVDKCHYVNYLVIDFVCVVVCLGDEIIHSWLSAAIRG